MSIFKQIFEYINPSSKIHFILELSSYVLFASAMFSIPACSFTSGMSFITWILSGLFILDILLICFLYYKIRIDLINISLLLFCLVALLSTLLNNAFQSFTFTPIVLCIFTAIVYTYCASNSKSRYPLLIAAFVGIICFSILYFVKYFPELINFDFGRLGNIFGDNNDIAIILTIGTVIAFWLIFKVSKISYKIVLSLIAIFLLYCGFTTGSKILLIEIIICGIIGPFTFVKKDKWWIVAISLVGIIGIIVGFLFLPIGSVLRDRIAKMFITIFNPQEAVSTHSYDTSTAIRFDMFLDGMTMFLRKPLFGYGIHGFYRASSYGYGWSHNNISESLCSFGLVGTFLFHFGLVYSFYNCCKKKNKILLDRLYFMLFLFFLICMISVALNSQKVYAFLIGICIAEYSNLKPIIEISYGKEKKILIS